MSNGENGKSGPQFRSGPLIVSAVLVGAGTLIALTGLAVGGGYVASLTRQWVREMEVPPSELARPTFRANPDPGDHGPPAPPGRISARHPG